MLKMFDFLRGPAALAALLLAVAPAAAAEPATEAPAKATEDYEPRPALWLLADEDTKIYLFGTIHILPKGFRWISPAVERAIGEADELVVETYEAPGSTDNLDAMALLMLDEPVPLVKRVPKQHRPALRKAIKAVGLQPKMLDHFQTWMAAMMLGMAAILDEYGASDPAEAAGVEDVLERRFRDAKKPILSVEDPAEVVRAMNALPQEIQTGLLIDGLIEAGDQIAEAGIDDRAWATGDFEKLAMDDPKVFPPALREPLLTRRNAAWTVWLEERLKKPGTVLFAVGAGHMAGADSVQKLLAARGLEAKRID